MKLLPDSNIFIDYWRNRDGLAQKYESVFSNEEILISGVVRAELLHGARSEKHLQSMSAMLDAFEDVNLEGTDWNTLGEYLYKLRMDGITVPLADAMIAATAIKLDIPVWTGDNHFELMKTMLPQLKIYEA